MRKSKVEKAAHLLDDEMRVHLSHLRVHLYIRTMDIRSLDAVVALAGEAAVPCYPGTTASWRCAKEGSILILLQQCIPHMQWQRELAEAIVKFLEVDTVADMFDALVDVLRLREPRRTGRLRDVMW